MVVKWVEEKIRRNEIKDLKGQDLGLLSCQMPVHIISPNLLANVTMNLKVTLLQPVLHTASKSSPKIKLHVTLMFKIFQWLPMSSSSISVL